MRISRLAVVGCGMMGRGIIETCAGAGIHVTAIKATSGALADLKNGFRQSLEERLKRGRLTAAQLEEIFSRIEFTRDIAAVSNAQLVIESVVETLDTKQDILRRIEAEMADDAVLGTNTSSLRLETLAADLTRPSRFMGVHFFSPVAVMDLVELGATAQTADHVVERCRGFCTQIGKTPVVTSASPGYVVNRLLIPYLLQAIRTFEIGVAGAEAIDTTMKLGCGYPMGPLALADFIGLDVLRSIALALAAELDAETYRHPKLLDDLVAANQLGRKTQRGIYDYSGVEKVVNPAVAYLMAQPGPAVGTSSK